MPGGNTRSWEPFPLHGKKLNDFLQNVGVRGLEVKELFDHPKSSEGLRAIILFYKWHPNDNSLRRMSLNQEQNKCVPRCVAPTLALMDIIMSLGSRNGFRLCPELVSLKKFISPMDSSLRFAILNNSEFVRSAHNETLRFEDEARGEVSYDELWHHAVFDPQVNSNYGSSSAGSGEDVSTRHLNERIDYHLGLLRDNSIPHRLFGVFDEIPGYESEEESRSAESQNREQMIRNHDYTRFIVEMTKIMSSQGALKDLITKELRSAAEQESEEGSNHAMDDDDNSSARHDSRSGSSRTPSSSESERSR